MSSKYFVIKDQYGRQDCILKIDDISVIHNVYEGGDTLKFVEIIMSNGKIIHMKSDNPYNLLKDLEDLKAAIGEEQPKPKEEHPEEVPPSVLYNNKANVNGVVTGSHYSIIEEFSTKGQTIWLLGINNRCGWLKIHNPQNIEALRIVDIPLWENCAKLILDWKDTERSLIVFSGERKIALEIQEGILLATEKIHPSQAKTSRLGSRY